MSHLVEEHSSVDPTYVEDFLLTYRTFLKSPIEVAERLTEWFNNPTLRDKVSDKSSGHCKIYCRIAVICCVAAIREHFHVMFCDVK